jgi:hypothetical protein
MDLLLVAPEPINGNLQINYMVLIGPINRYAITLNYVSELEGKKAQIAKAMEVKSHLERALELNPLDATTWHILGMFVPGGITDIKII